MNQRGADPEPGLTVDGFVAEVLEGALVYARSSSAFGCRWGRAFILLANLNREWSAFGTQSSVSSGYSGGLGGDVRLLGWLVDLGVHVKFCKKKQY